MECSLHNQRHDLPIHQYFEALIPSCADHRHSRTNSQGGHVRWLRWPNVFHFIADHQRFSRMHYSQNSLNMKLLRLSFFLNNPNNNTPQQTQIKTHSYTHTLTHTDFLIFNNFLKVLFPNLFTGFGIKYFYSKNV